MNGMQVLNGLPIDVRAQIISAFGSIEHFYSHVYSTYRKEYDCNKREGSENYIVSDTANREIERIHTLLKSFGLGNARAIMDTIFIDQCLAKLAEEILNFTRGCINLIKLFHTIEK